MSAPPLAAREEWRAHWPMVIAAMVGMGFYSIVTYSLGVFIEPLEKEFGWSRTLISGGLTLFALVTMVGSPLIGLALDRFGTRRIALIGMALSAAALAAFALNTGSQALWLGLWAVFAVVALSVKSTTWSTGVSSVFSAWRGFALAVALAGTALGQALSPLIANHAIAAHGWRAAYVWLGLGWGGFALVLLALFYFDARDGRSRAVLASATPAARALPGLTLREALRDRRIQRIMALNLIYTTVGSAITVHLVPILVEAGAGRTEAVSIAASAGLSGLAGKFITGWLLDRREGNLVPFTSFALPPFAWMLYLGASGSSVALFAGALVAGYASGASFQCTAYLLSRYAGLRAFGTIYGIVGSVIMAGTAVGPTLAGMVHDASASYRPLLLGAVPLVFAASLLMLGLGPYPDYSQQAPEEGNPGQ